MGTWHTYIPAETPIKLMALRALSYRNPVTPLRKNWNGQPHENTAWKRM